jgi:hypothetical protein
LKKSSSHINHVLKKGSKLFTNQPNAAAPNHLKPCPSLSLTPKAHQKEASNPQCSSVTEEKKEKSTPRKVSQASTGISSSSKKTQVKAGHGRPQFRSSQDNKEKGVRKCTA